MKSHHTKLLLSPTVPVHGESYCYRLTTTVIITDCAATCPAAHVCRWIAHKPILGMQSPMNIQRIQDKQGPVNLGVRPLSMKNRCVTSKVVEPWLPPQPITRRCLGGSSILPLSCCSFGLVFRLSPTVGLQWQHMLLSKKILANSFCPPLQSEMDYSFDIPYKGKKINESTRRSLLFHYWFFIAHVWPGIPMLPTQLVFALQDHTPAPGGGCQIGPTTTKTFCSAPFSLSRRDMVGGSVIIFPASL